jgi:transcriptional regulator with XRE-family HTH domain
MRETINELFGANLAKLRTARDLTQLELSQKAGLHSESISRYERGATSPSLENIFAIAKALKVKVPVLVRSEWINKKR